MKSLLIFCAVTVLLGWPPSAQAQAKPRTPVANQPLGEAPAYASPAGVWVFFGKMALSEQRPYERLKGLRVLRADADKTNFREIGRLEQAATLADFQRIAGPSALSAVRQRQKLADDAAAWAFIQAHPNIEDYGALGQDFAFQRAIGTAFLDETARTAPAGTRYHYRLVPRFTEVKEKDQPNDKIGFDKTVEMGRPAVVLRRPRLRPVPPTDTLLRLTWTMPYRRPTGPAMAAQVFGQVFRQRPGQVAFEALPGQIMAHFAAKSRDTLRLEWTGRVRPEALYRFYVQPLDFVGNSGPASDTATVLTVDPRRVKLLTGASARDTATGLYLKWPALPAKPYYVGIEVQRSRDARGNFVRLDTIAPTATGYLDTRLLPNITYYYRLRALLGGGVPAAPDVPSATAFGTHRGKAGPRPIPPHGLTAEAEGVGGIRLKWQPADAAAELNLDGYYVCRGTSMQDSLRPVSPPIRGFRPEQLTFLDTTARNPRRQYVYAVLAVARSGQQSVFSNKAAAQPKRPLALAAPLGISGYADAQAVHLTWDDAQRRDPAVVGYRLYRRPAPAVATGTPAAYELLTDRLLPAPFYDDANVRSGQRYEYAATALDGLGNESPRTAPAAIVAYSVPLPAPVDVSVRPLEAGLEVSWASVTVPAPSGYALYRRAREQTEPQRITTLPANQLAYRDLAAKPGILYLYSISAVRDGQESPRSPETGVQR